MVCGQHFWQCVQFEVVNYNFFRLNWWLWSQLGLPLKLTITTIHSNKIHKGSSNLFYGNIHKSSQNEKGSSMVESTDTEPVIFDWRAHIQRTMDYYTAKLEEAKNTSQSLSCPPSPAKSVSSVASSDVGPEQQLPPIQWTTTAMLCFLGSPKTWVVPKTINGMRWDYHFGTCTVFPSEEKRIYFCLTQSYSILRFSPATT